MLTLCSTSNVCLYDSSPPPTLAELVGKGILPRVYDQETDPHVAVEEFLRSCVNLLVNGSVHVREAVKEALGSELPPALRRSLVIQMTK